MKINLPQPSKFSGTLATEQFLRQLEIAVHHAQKSLKEMDKMLKETSSDEPEQIDICYEITAFEEFDESSNMGNSDYVELRLFSN